MKKQLFVFGIIAVLVFLVVLSLSIFDYSKDSYFKQEFSGIVEGVKRSENHGSYYFYVDDAWRYFGTNGNRINHFLVVGDSLVKKGGEDKVLIYRKDQNSNFDKHKAIELTVYPLQRLD